MRILDEHQMFQVGDEVQTTEGEIGIVKRVNSHSVYYEARPIASYTRYYYIIDVDGKTRSLKLEQIVSPQ